MKIYGKENDYYDCALAYGQDPLCQWNRKFTLYSTDDFKIPESVTGEIDTRLPSLGGTNTGRPISLTFTDSNPHVHSIRSGFVFFCGKTYPFIKVGCYNSYNTFYDMDSLLKHMVKVYGEKKTNELLNDQPKFGKSNKEKIEKHLNKDFTCEDIHRVHGVPVYIMIGGSIISEGGCLKDVDFVKVLDPFTCLQEINMYISGVLGGNSPSIVDISDTDRLEGKGFDKVKSFRNMKRG